MTPREPAKRTPLAQLERRPIQRFAAHRMRTIKRKQRRREYENLERFIVHHPPRLAHAPTDVRQLLRTPPRFPHDIDILHRNRKWKPQFLRLDIQNLVNRFDLLFHLHVHIVDVLRQQNQIVLTVPVHRHVLREFVAIIHAVPLVPGARGQIMVHLVDDDEIARLETLPPLAVTPRFVRIKKELRIQKHDPIRQIDLESQVFRQTLVDRFDMQRNIRNKPSRERLVLPTLELRPVRKHVHD